MLPRLFASSGAKRTLLIFQKRRISKLPSLIRKRLHQARSFHNQVHMSNNINRKDSGSSLSRLPTGRSFSLTSGSNKAGGARVSSSFSKVAPIYFQTRATSCGISAFLSNNDSKGLGATSCIFSHKNSKKHKKQSGNNPMYTCYQQVRGTALNVSNTNGNPAFMANPNSKFNVLFSPELVGIKQEAERMDNEHKAAKIPFNLAFDAALEHVPKLGSKKEINVLEIGFGSGAVIEGTFDYFKDKKRKVTIHGIDKESRWLDYCNKKFKHEIEDTKRLRLFEMDATNIDDLLHLKVNMYDKFDIILFRFFLSHVLNFEGVFKYMTRYLLNHENGVLIIQDGILPSPAGTILLPQMHSLPDVIGSKYNINVNSPLQNKRTNPREEFPHLFKFANETAAPVLSNVMRFDVEYVLPSLVQESGMKTIWQNEMTLGGLNGTFGFEMAISNLISNVTRFRLLGVITEDEAKKIIEEIEYAKTLPQSRSYVLLPLITRVVCPASQSQ